MKGTHGKFNERNGIKDQINLNGGDGTGQGIRIGVNHLDKRMLLFLLIRRIGIQPLGTYTVFHGPCLPRSRRRIVMDHGNGRWWYDKGFDPLFVGSYLPLPGIQFINDG